MFQTVRHWWGSGRGRVTARLFLFEFVVVVAGVLVAQALAGLAQNRAESREGRALIDRALTFGVYQQRLVNYWSVHGPCLRSHVEHIAREAVAGHSMTTAQIGRPAIPQVSKLNLGEDEWNKIRTVASDAQMDQLLLADSNRATAERYSVDLTNEWATLRLLDSAIGPSSAEDRARVRLATAVIEDRLRWMVNNRGQWEEMRRKLGIAPNRELPPSEKYVDACGLLKDWR